MISILGTTSNKHFEATAEAKDQTAPKNAAVLFPVLREEESQQSYITFIDFLKSECTEYSTA